MNNECIGALKRRLVLRELDWRGWPKGTGQARPVRSNLTEQWSRGSVQEGVATKEITFFFPANPHSAPKSLCEGDEWRPEELLLWSSTLSVTVCPYACGHFDMEN